MEGAAAAAVVGTGMQMYSQYQEAQAQQEAAEARAAAKRAQAEELAARATFNIATTIKDGEELEGQQTAGFAGSGVAVGEGSALSVLEETDAKIKQSVMIQQRESELKVQALMRGADLDTQLSGDINRASKYRMAATFLSGAGSFMSATGSGTSKAKPVE